MPHAATAGRGARGKTAAISFLPIYLYNGGLAPNRRADKFKVLRQTRVLNCDMQSPRQPKPLYKATRDLGIVAITLLNPGVQLLDWTDFGGPGPLVGENADSGGWFEARTT